MKTASVSSEHATIDQAFAELDRSADRMAQQNIPADALELYVVDDARRRITRES